MMIRWHLDHEVAYEGVKGTRLEREQVKVLVLTRNRAAMPSPELGQGRSYRFP